MTVDWITTVVSGTFLPVEESPVLCWPCVAALLGVKRAA